MQFGVAVMVLAFILYLLTGLTWLTLVEIGGALCSGSNPAYSISSNTASITLPISLDNVSN